MSEFALENTGLFAGIAEDLLAGKFICRYTNEAAYRHLSDETNFEGMDGFLRRLNRRLRSSEDGLVFYAAYTDVDSQERRSSIKNQFRVTITQIEPLVRWLGITMSAQRTNIPLEPGSQISEGEMLMAIEAAPALADELHLLASGPFFKTKQDTAKQQLGKLLDMLCEQGYLKKNNQKGSQYTATGKWSYLYEVMAFIAEHEHIDISHNPETQQELIQ